MDVPDDSITPACEFVWVAKTGGVMTLSRECLQILLDQNINDRLNLCDMLLVYLRRTDLPEISAERRRL